MTKPPEDILQRLCVRIAELCDWKLIQLPRITGFVWMWLPPGEHLHKFAKASVPDFTGSLDAIHEAEKKLLTQDMRMGLYADHLQFISGYMSDEDHREYVSIQSYEIWIELPASETFKRLVHAPAYARAIALDRTLSETPIC